MKISRELYRSGYKIGAESKRNVIFIEDSDGKRYQEIAFKGKDDILIMTEFSYIWVKEIASIGIKNGVPVITVAR